MNTKTGFVGIVPVIIIGVLLLAIGGYFFLYQRGGLPSQATPPAITSIPTSIQPENWKTFTLENISFKYPGDWGEPETFDADFGLAGTVESNNGEYKIRVLTGLNKGHTTQENEKFIEDYFQEGGRKLTVDGSLAGLRTIKYQGVKIITVYILSKNKDSVDSISITSKEDDENAEKTFDQILSTFQFLD